MRRSGAKRWHPPTPASWARSALRSSSRGGSPSGGRAHVFVADVDVERPDLSPDDRHHLERVLRLRTGDEITVSDGAGRWRVCRFGEAAVEYAGDVQVEAAPAPAIAVGFALTKGERPEWAVQKLTEVGVDRIIPFVAERSIVRWTPDRAAANVERWRRIVREASGQCRRVWLPVVDDVRSFEEIVAGGGTGDGAAGGVALADRDGDAPSLDHPLVLVGPEGGWSDGERAVAVAAGVARIALGPHVLRAETAAMAAGVLLCGLRSGLVGNA